MAKQRNEENQVVILDQPIETLPDKVQEVIEALPVDETVEAAHTESSTPSSFGVYTPQAARKRGANIMVYGSSGVGKTHLAGSFPKPVFLDFEGGMAPVAEKLPLRYPKNPKRVVERLEQVDRFYDLCVAELSKPQPAFKTIVIDSLNQFKIVLEQNTLGTFKDKNREYVDQLTLNDYGKVKRDFQAYFQKFQKLPCTVVFIAHMEPKKYEEDQAVPSLGSVSTFVQRLCDAVGYCFTRLTNDSEVRYFVNFTNTPDHIGKDRLSIGSKNLQNDFSAIFDINS